METPVSVARCLQRDLGLDAGARYADRIAQFGDGAMAILYHDAAVILRNETERIKASCAAGSYDLGV